MSRFTPQKINRIIDANINRTKEGLRVCEEIARFILESRSLTFKFKQIRHEIDTLIKKLPIEDLLKERESNKDIGKNIFLKELERNSLQDIFSANLQRIKESLRVLEEFCKLKHRDLAKAFKKIRYDIYGLEKRASGKILALCHFR